MSEFCKNLAECLAHSVVHFSNPQGVELFAFGPTIANQPSAPAANETTDQMLRSLTANLPGLMQAQNQEILGNEMAQAEASRQVSPIYSQINRDIYDTTGRELNTIGNEIARENALAQAGTDAAVLKGPGMELVRSGLDAAKIFDPEYFQTRETMSNQLAQLMNGGLTGGEREEITRGLAQQDLGQGTLNKPSNINAVENAMTYGNEARNRLSQGLALATGALPAFRSNVDTFQQATGRSSAMNTGEARTGGAAQGMGQQAAGASQGLMNQIGQNARQAVDINSGRYNQMGPSTFDNITKGFSAFNPFG